MRKITSQIADAFNSHRSLKVGNTTTDGEAVYLHGHKIVERRSDGVYFTLAGYPTSTTKERVNGIAGAGVYQKNFTMYRNGEEIESNKWIKI